MLLARALSIGKCSEHQEREKPSGESEAAQQHHRGHVSASKTGNIATMIRIRLPEPASGSLAESPNGELEDGASARTLTLPAVRTRDAPRPTYAAATSSQ